MNEKGFIPIVIVVIFTIAVGLVIGAKLEQHHINQTMVCHDPNERIAP